MTRKRFPGFDFMKRMDFTKQNTLTTYANGKTDPRTRCLSTIGHQPRNKRKPSSVTWRPFAMRSIISAQRNTMKTFQLNQMKFCNGQTRINHGNFFPHQRNCFFAGVRLNSPRNDFASYPTHILQQFAQTFACTACLPSYLSGIEESELGSKLVHH